MEREETLEVDLGLFRARVVAGEGSSDTVQGRADVVLDDGEVAEGFEDCSFDICQLSEGPGCVTSSDLRS